jgi:tetratricopeptide (TPR) repeat protein
LQSLGRNSEAEKAFRRALELRKNWNLPMEKLSEVLIRNNKFPEAEMLLIKLLAFEPDNIPAFLALTELGLKTDAPPKILKSFLTRLQEISAKNQNASIWAVRGAVERNLGDNAAAKASLVRALTLDPKNLFALSETAELSLAENNFAEAQIMTEKLIKSSPNFIGYQVLLARIFAAQGKNDQALQILTSLDDKNSDVSSLKNSLAATGTKDIAVLEKQLTDDPKNAVILGRLCVLARPIPAKALDYCRRALDSEPNNVGHAVGFGAALVQGQKFPEAVSLLRRLLLLEPENFAIHANLALALFKSNNFAEAKLEYEWLIAKNPNLSAAYYFLAICHDNLQEYQEAMTNYRKFLQLVDVQQNQLEIDKINLRLPSLERQIKQGQGKKKKA